jgi:hypothetical protein
MVAVLAKGAGGFELAERDARKSPGRFGGTAGAVRVEPWATVQ